MACHHPSHDKTPHRRRLRAACGALFALTALSAAIQPAWAQTPPAEPAREAATLPAVKVKARSASPTALPRVLEGAQAASGARLGLLGNQEVLDTPFNITSYTAELIADQQAKTVASVLAFDPSVRFTTSGSHAYENLRLRGFDVESSDLAFNGLYGLAPVGNSTLEFVERVEVLKGPSAMFSGMSPSGDIGGMVNLVPKRAGDQPLTRVSLGYESASQLSTTLDVGRRFGEDQAWGVRVNAAYSDGETALDGQDKTRHMAAAALDYRGTALKASLDLYDTRLSFTGGSPAMYGFATTSIPAAPDPGVNFLKGAAGELESRAAIAHAEVDLGQGLSAFASLGARQHDYSGWVNGTHAHSVRADGTAQVRGVAQLGFNDGVSSELGLRMNLDTAGLAHEVVLQATRLSLKSGVLSNVTSMQSSNIYDPATPTLPAMPTGSVPTTSESTLSGLALVDTVSLLRDRVRLTLGLRQQQVEQTSYSASTGAATSRYDEKALTPAVGLVVKPWGDGLSLYANFVQGLSQGSSVTDVSATNYGQVFAPYKTEQREVGVKWQSGAFLNTAALFQIDKPTMMSTGDSSRPTYTDGAQTRVRGLEWNTAGLASPTVRLLGGISYTRSELTRTQGGTNQGNEVFGVPRWQANLGSQWDTPLHGLSLSARVQATSSLYLDNANTYRIPGWGQLDLGAAYTTRLADRPLVLRLNVDNALDRHYWSGSFAETRATLAQGRVLRTSATMDF